MISVVMPAYNASAFIAQAIESILNQSLKTFELIIIDDGSTDNTVSIIEYYAAQDDRIKFIQNEHGGANVARNTGLRVAKYDWVAMMDADDIAMPGRLETLLAATVEHPEVIIWGSYVEQIGVDGRSLGIAPIGPITLEEFYATDRRHTPVFITNPSAMFRRDIALKVGGYDENLPAAQETELWDRMIAYGPMLSLPKPLLKYRIHGQSISAKKFFVQREITHYIVERYRASVEGRTLSLAQYREEYAQRPAIWRWLHRISMMGRYHYRNTGIYVSQRQYLQALKSLLLALYFNPGFVYQRIKKRLAFSIGFKRSG